MESKPSPRTQSLISNAVEWAERILGYVNGRLRLEGLRSLAGSLTEQHPRLQTNLRNSRRHPASSCSPENKYCRSRPLTP
jgi:hypothetical protein